MDSHARRHFALFLLKLSDAVWFLLAYVIARLPTLQLPAFQTPGLQTPPAVELLLVVIVLVAWHKLLTMRGLHSSRRLDHPGSELSELVVVASLQVSIVVTAGLLLGVSWIAAGLFAMTLFVSLLALTVGSRLSMRVLLRMLRANGRNLRFALVIGSGPRALHIVALLNSRRGMGYRVIGCVDDTPPPAGSGVPWMGAIDELKDILSGNVVDEVFVALPARSRYDSIEIAVRLCEEQGVAVTMPADFIPVRFACLRVSQLEERVLLRLGSVHEDSWQLSAKRLLDLAAGLVLVIMLAPALLAIALAIRATSPGPALFRQVRVGLNKRPFTLYKFRTMTRDAEEGQCELEALNEAAGPVFKMRRDPRVTPLGRWLRRTSLDELPQLLNVLLGNMSLVGPRPLPLRDVKGFSKDWQRRRFSVLPGITCLWQTSGRSNISFERWMEMDLEYIDRWSLWLDISILIRTMPAVLRREGAY